MRIVVDKIPDGGMEIAEQIVPSNIPLDLEMQGISFTGTIDAKAKVKKIGGEVFVNVTIQAPCEYTCARCLARLQNVFNKRFDVNYEAKPGDILEIDEDIRQEIILNYPMKIVCNPDCKGLCPNCGQNLNISTCDCDKETRNQSTENKIL